MTSKTKTSKNRPSVRAVSTFSTP